MSLISASVYKPLKTLTKLNKLKAYKRQFTVCAAGLSEPQLHLDPFLVTFGQGRNVTGAVCYILNQQH